MIRWGSSIFPTTLMLVDPWLQRWNQLEVTGLPGTQIENWQEFDWVHCKSSQFQLILTLQPPVNEHKWSRNNEESLITIITKNLPRRKRQLTRKGDCWSLFTAAAISLWLDSSLNADDRWVFQGRASRFATTDFNLPSARSGRRLNLHKLLKTHL